MRENIKIVVVDDHKLFRQGISSMLRPFGIVTIGEAGDGLELIELLRKITPQIILLDIGMPNMDGNQSLFEVKKQYPGIKVIMLTTYLDNSLRKNFIEKGADEFLTKTTDIKEIIEVINKVHFQTSNVRNINAGKDRFTASELKIIPLMCTSLTLKDIAEKLNLSEKAVEAHRQRIYKKIGAQTKTEFMNYAISYGLQYLDSA